MSAIMFAPMMLNKHSRFEDQIMTVTYKEHPQTVSNSKKKPLNIADKTA